MPHETLTPAGNQPFRSRNVLLAQQAGIVFVDPVIELPQLEPVAPVEADPHIKFWSEQIFPALEWAAERHDLLGFVVRSARDQYRLDPPLAAFALGLASWAVDIPGPGRWFGPDSELEPLASLYGPG